MKAIIFLITLFLGFECFGQVTPKEVIYGTIRTDGYQKITKGAFWTTRPEAKLIYEGKTPPKGYNVYVLESDYFVRFQNGENNQFDQNYIVFPRGEKVYTYNGQFYSAICGNKIEYIRAVNLVEIKTVVIQRESNFSSTNEVDDWGAYKSPRKLFESYEEEINPNYSNSFVVEEKEKLKFFKRKGVRIIGGAIVGIGVVYLGDKLVRSFDSDYIDPIPIIEPRTMPPGIPAVEPRTTPGLPADPRTMPGGIGFVFNF